jgi:hypothetical protein
MKLVPFIIGLPVPDENGVFAGMEKKITQI